MKAVIQRVKNAAVTVDGKLVSSIDRGVLTLLGVSKGDDEAKVARLIAKIADLRLFEDNDGKMNLSLRDVGGEHLLVSQFTLLGDCTRGTRPSFSQAELPDRARDLYELALKESEKHGLPTKGGVFRAHMEVNLTNDGPVTLLIDL